MQLRPGEISKLQSWQQCGNPNGVGGLSALRGGVSCQRLKVGIGRGLGVITCLSVRETEVKVVETGLDCVWQKQGELLRGETEVKVVETGLDCVWQKQGELLRGETEVKVIETGLDCVWQKQGELLSGETEVKVVETGLDWQKQGELLRGAVGFTANDT